MNKPLHLQQNASEQAAMENRINRNLSPSLARIQALAAKVVPSHSNTTDKKEDAPLTSAPKLSTVRPGEAQHLSTEPTSSARNTFHSPPPTANHHTSASASARITPWIIASITLTLALFSGNYAWHTQQQVETLSLRLEQLEAHTLTPPVTGLQESNDNFANTEQTLLTLKQAQGQQAVTISVLQNDFAIDTEQTSSRFTTLEESLADLISQGQAAALHQEATLNQATKEALLTQSIDSESRTETTLETIHGETGNDSKTAESKNIEVADSATTKNWSINIASFSDHGAAKQGYEKVLNIVDKASIKPITVNGKTLYRIRAENYGSRAQAEHEALTLQTKLGLSGLWVSRD